MKNILEIFRFNKEKDLINYLIKPTKTTEYVKQKNKKFKLFIVINLLILYTLTSIWTIYFWIWWNNISSEYYLKIFFYNILSILIFSFIIWYIWKLFKWFAKYIDVLIVNLLSLIVLIIFSILMIIINLFWISLSFLPEILLFTAIIWYLVIWSKWLSKIFDISEGKVTYIVVISFIIIYFLNWVLYNILEIS